MTEGRLPEILSQPALALALVGLWLVLACLLPVLLSGRRQRRATRAMVLAGVPALGWVTLLWGPGIGVAGFGLGLLILLGHPSGRRSRHRPGPASAQSGRDHDPVGGGAKGQS
ncbi:DUF2484 domain-containing protein [Paracoccus nototheniae]|uniref:DUF2484 family protein n=1 Tax=Paracoccus nototheniae TaxID=2489002 RepID=A0ABW4DYC0_9RHOB|nr:DUF2484 family protein [Paracoccus nototheniae]